MRAQMSEVGFKFGDFTLLPKQKNTPKQIAKVTLHVVRISNSSISCVPSVFIQQAIKSPALEVKGRGYKMPELTGGFVVWRKEANAPREKAG